jgi:acyl-CoA synthetase (AMP-forming)/AMP-acid ligase II
MSEPSTLLRCLDRAAASGEAVRFVERSRDRWLTYREILDRSRAVAGGLKELGVEPGARVGVAAPTGPSFYEAFFGVVAAGGAPISLPLPPRFGSGGVALDELGASLRAAGARLVLTDVEGRVRLPDVGVLSLGEIPDATPHEVDRDADSLALVQLSSGTTGAPKPVPLTHRQILSNVRAIADRILESYPADRHRHGGVSWLPLYHDMGLVGAALTAMAHPAPLALLKPEDFVGRPARWLQTLSRLGATVSAAPNFAYDLAVDRIRDDELEGVDLSRWLVALVGAEPVSATTLARFQERFRGYGLREEALTPVYGLAEASLAVTFSHPRAPFTSRKFDGRLLSEGRAVEEPAGVGMVSAGTPLQGVEVEIADSDGARLPEARVGRVLVRGASVTSEGVDAEGLLDTGDLGFVHEGELYLSGRSRDLLILRGRNVSPDAIEDALTGIPGLRAAAAVSRGPELLLLVERSAALAMEEEKTIVDEIRTRALERCGVDPRVILLEAGALPRTSSGKIRRREAARLFAWS